MQSHFYFPWAGLSLALITSRSLFVFGSFQRYLRFMFRQAGRDAELRAFARMQLPAEARHRVKPGKKHGEADLFNYWEQRLRGVAPLVPAASKSTAAAVSDSATVPSSSSPFAAAASSSIPTGAMNISSFVRQKRKPEDSAAPAASAPENGSSSSTPNAVKQETVQTVLSAVEPKNYLEGPADGLPEAKRVKTEEEV